MLDHCRAAGEALGPPPERPPGQAGLANNSGTWTARLDASIRAQLPILSSRAHVFLGQLDGAEAGLLGRFATVAEAEASQPGTLAMIACLGGRLSDAYRLGRAALQQGHAQARCWDPASLNARLAMAEVLFEHDELDLAAGQLDAARYHPSLDEMAHWTWAVEVELVRVMIGQERRPRSAHPYRATQAIWGTEPATPPNPAEIGPRRDRLPSRRRRPGGCPYGGAVDPSRGTIL